MISSPQKSRQPSLWSVADTDRAPSLFRQELRRGNTIDHFITPAVPETQDILLFAQKTTWEILCRFNPDIASLHMVLASHAFKLDQPWSGEFDLVGSNLIEELNWQQQSDVTQAELFDRIAHAAWVLSGLAVKLLWSENTPNSSKDNTPQSSIDHARLWHVPLIREHGHANLAGEIEESQDLALSIEVGAWPEHFGNKDAAAEFDWMCQQVLRIDPRQYELAFRIAVYAFMSQHINARSEFRLRHLIKETLPHVYVERWQGDRRRTQEFRQELNETFKLLETLGWYVDGYGKESRLENLLASWVIVKPPRIGSQLARKPHKKRTVTVTGAEIKAFRESQNWSQEELADRLGVSTDMVSKMERDLRKISRRVAETVQSWRSKSRTAKI
ncbi:helix-turn-helix domain-containing protein [Pseudanabaena sp. PCC 6802]|uniref:helix-turn-helix domain-containing protein n=1 Tax=Pseudanabaena sp. PCC 6802 TaxID=118173 RepID=UPI0003454E2E|nr:helix-turn-helix transcriptional regulator [Pseudanabaena sp. PCC 6802]